MLSTILAIGFFACSIVIWANVRQIMRDQDVSGVAIWPTFVFLGTNVIELFYFADRLDWWSVAGAASMTLANVVWLVLALGYYNVSRIAKPWRGDCALHD